MTPPLTALVLTFNEEENIGRTLQALQALPAVVVLDSGSTDRTVAIAKSFPNVSVFSRPFDTHSNQWNFGLTGCGITSEWVLALDADYLLSEDLIQEILRRVAAGEADGYRLHFAYAIGGEVIRSGIYPPVTALFKRNRGVYEQDGHTQRLVLNGTTGDLHYKAVHDDRKPFPRWLQSQWRYAGLEAELLSSRKARKTVDRIRKSFPLTPFLVFLYCIFGRGGWRDGVRGWQYAWQRTLAEVLLQYQLLEIRLRS